MRGFVEKYRTLKYLKIKSEKFMENMNNFNRKATWDSGPDSNQDPTQDSALDPLGNQIKNEKCYGPLQDVVFNSSDSWAKKYRQLVCGDASIGFLIKVELITALAGGLPGAMGFALRKYLYKHIIKNMGNRVVFGRNISIGHPQNIHIGNNCLIADYCELNASGSDGAIIIGNNVTIGRHAFIRTKGGKIVIGDNSAIGARSILATRNTDITIGKNHMMSAFTYIGTGSHQYDRRDVPMNRQEFTARPVEIEDDVWIGIRSTILPGSRIRKGSVIGACSLVNGEVGSYQVVAGIPAKKIKDRGCNHIE
jgi:acetyltransferase-like isoleucine patch superfamily enzyme